MWEGFIESEGHTVNLPCSTKGEVSKGTEISEAVAAGGEGTSKERTFEHLHLSVLRQLGNEDRCTVRYKRSSGA